MKRLVSIPLLLSVIDLFAQNDRVNDHNYLNWIQTFNTISLNKKWSLHLEYQWRRSEGLKYWQQSLLRIGTNYKLNDNVTAHAVMVGSKPFHTVTIQLLTTELFRSSAFMNRSVFVSR
jgi:hypothetical protein